MSSPKKRGESSKHRPSTPHHGGKALDFDKGNSSVPARSGPDALHHIAGMAFKFDDDEPDLRINAPSESCIGISMATVMNTFRLPSLGKSLPSSAPSVRYDDCISFKPFDKFRSAVQKSLNCVTDSRTPRSHASVASGGTYDNYAWDDQRVTFDCETFERERSLMQRAASWDTLETTDSIGRKLLSPVNRNVQFHYPPITSVRLRPRTESEDIKQLFFAPEELDEIEDDRSDTKAADDIETLAVGADNWSSMPTCTSSIVTASYDDQDSSNGLMLGDGASNVMFDSAGSPRRSASDKRFVRGVQIMLREKSTR